MKFSPAGQLFQFNSPPPPHPQAFQVKQQAKIPGSALQEARHSASVLHERQNSALVLPHNPPISTPDPLDQSLDPHLTHQIPSGSIPIHLNLAIIQEILLFEKKVGISSKKARMQGGVTTWFHSSILILPDTVLLQSFSPQRDEKPIKCGKWLSAVFLFSSSSRISASVVINGKM